MKRQMVFLAFCCATSSIASCVGVSDRVADGVTVSAIYVPSPHMGGSGSVLIQPQPGAPHHSQQYPFLEAPDPTPQKATADWMVGDWLFNASPDDVHRWACNSGTVQSFEKDGTWQFFDGIGTWDISEDALIQVVREMPETSYVDDANFSDDSDTIVIGQAYRQSIRRIGPNEGAIYLNGDWSPMLRCRLTDFNIAPN